jgi:hypothetical protein
VAALVIGLAAGGMTAYVGPAERTRLADEAAVELILLADSSLPTEVSVGDRLLRFRQELTVVNTGPLPVEVTDVRGKDSGIEVRGTTSRQVIEPGVAQPVELNLTVSCAPKTLGQLVWVNVTVLTRSSGSRGRTLQRVVSVNSPLLAEWVDRRCGRGR